MKIIMVEKEKHAVDRRVRKTKKLLKQGLITLMMEKDINDITINELVNLIDINRGTFYLHCRDLRDLLTQIQDEVMTEMNRILEKYSAEDMQTQDLPFIIDILKYIKENADLCTLLMKENGDATFLNKLKRMVEENCFENLKLFYQHDNPYAYSVFATFSVSGAIGIIQLWLSTGHKEPVEVVAKTLSQLIDKGLGYLNSPSATAGK